MEMFIIVVLLVLVGLLYNRLKESQDRERELIEPGYLKRREKYNQLLNKLGRISSEQDELIRKAMKSGEKISFWTHRAPSKQGRYKVLYKENGNSPLSNIPEFRWEEIRLYQSDESYTFNYSINRHYKEFLEGESYWDGARFDLPGVYYHKVEMNYK